MELENKKKKTKKLEIVGRDGNIINLNFKSRTKGSA